MILMNMLGNRVRVIRMCVEEMELGRETWKERCC